MTGGGNCLLSTVTNLESIERQGALVYGVLVYCITLMNSPFFHEL